MRKTFFSILCATSLLGLSACAVDEPISFDQSLDNSTGSAADTDTHPNGKGAGVYNQEQHTNNGAGNGHGKPGGGANGISYHNGPVMLGTTNVHYIYYGNFSADKNTLENLARNIGGSPYFNINTSYYNGSNVHVSNSVSFAGSATDNYSHGTSLSDAAIQAVVAAQNPTDTNGVYFVLTSPDVTASSGFCTQYCGWHTHGTINGRDIKYSFVGDPTRCPSACSEQNVGPNGSSGADGMASIISHELEESVTDPDLNAWYDSRGAENADKCAWTFGAEYTSGGARANMNLGGKDYLIQQNWVNASGGYCAKSF